MAKYRTFKVTSLPSPLKPTSVYIVLPDPVKSYVEYYITNKDGSKAYRLPNEADISQMIQDKITASGGLKIVDDIPARDALTDKAGEIYVTDASGDATVTSGGAGYLWDTVNSVWIKVRETESMDIALTWDGLTGKPNVTVAQIESAVANSHTHANKTQLDGIGKDTTTGELTFEGNPVAVHWNTNDDGTVVDPEW